MGAALLLLAVTEALTLQTPAGAIEGTLLAPAGHAPLVVIIAGSGPTDRDGNSTLLPGKNDSLKLLAEGLAARGVASLRYDKRGLGNSRAAMTSEADLRFEMYADDAAGWVKKLRADPRFGPICVAGHSEGSLLGMLAVQRSGAEGFVSIAGAGRKADVVLREQLAPKLPLALLAKTNAALDELVAGRTVASPPPELAALFRASVQPYLISWFKVDPQAEIARLAVPVLIAQGTLDAQVPPADAELLSRAQPKAKLLRVEGMNHVMKRVPADAESQTKSYSDPAIPDAPELIDAVAAFAKSLKHEQK